MKLSARHIGGMALVFLALLTTGIVLNRRSASAGHTRLASARFIPAEGLAENDTGGKVLGNVQNAVEDLKEIYKLVNIYRERNGKYPAGSDLIRDMHETPEVYGYRSLKEADFVFLNPDTRLSDMGKRRQGSREPCPYIMINKRPDGTPAGDAKQPGKKDLLTYTALYIFHNNRYFRGERSTTNPVGYYVLLWDDGTITQVPYDQIILVRKGKNRYGEAFPGQTGMPSDTITYDQFYRESGARRGPRGKEGAKGKSYTEW